MTREQLEHFAAHVAAATALHLVECGVIDAESEAKITNEWTPILLPKSSILERLRTIFRPENKNEIGYLIRFTKLPKP